jgi:hypothetical protein
MWTSRHQIEMRTVAAAARCAGKREQMQADNGIQPQLK